MAKKSKENKREYPKGRKVLFESYPQYFSVELQKDTPKETLQECFDKLCKLHYVEKVACIVHDRFSGWELEHEPDKKLHLHFVCTFSNSVTYKTIADSVGLAEHTICKIDCSEITAFLYLIHKNEPNKYQFDPKEVVANFDYVDMVYKVENDIPIKTKPKSVRQEIADKIADGTIKGYNIFDFVEVDEYAKNKKYYQNCFEYRQNKMKRVDRNMECMYFYGGAGAGKTTLAKHYARAYGYHCFIASSGKDPLGDYNGEECIILDDTRSSNWNLTDFLKLTDNHTDSLVGSRYYNKSIAECKMLIVTSVKSIDEFYTQAQKEEGEPIVQLKRRFPLVVEVSKQKLKMYEYSEDKQDHIYLATSNNPVAMFFPSVDSNQMAENMISLLGLEISDDVKKSMNNEQRKMPDGFEPLTIGSTPF